MTAPQASAQEKGAARPGIRWKQPANRDVLVRAFPFPPVRANYLINISTTLGYAYFETPKVACSTVKRALQKAEIDKVGGALANDVHDKESSPLQSPSDLELGLNDVFVGDAYFRFGFVRNPYSRVLSAYLDKIVQNEWERNRHLPQLGFASDSRPTFLEFLERIEKQTSAEKDIHWVPQCDLLAWDRVKLNYVGRFESFAPDFALIGRKLLGEGAAKYTATVVAPHQTDARSKVIELIGPKERDVIERIYDRDFGLYCYSRDPFFATT